MKVYSLLENSLKMTNKKIVFRLDGGTKIGTGKIVKCSLLAHKLKKNVKVVLVHEDDSMSSGTAKMMNSLGLDAYYLKGGMKAWEKEVVKDSPSTLIKPENLWDKIQEQNVLLLDTTLQLDTGILLIQPACLPKEFQEVLFLVAFCA